MSEPALETRPLVQVVIPARDEEASVGRCLNSLTSQQGIDFQITVVDDRSSDRTREIAESFPGVRLISVPEPPPGVTGKCNALIHGAQGAIADWLLFTDADTFHCPRSLARLVKRAEILGADLFSVSPEQETGSWSEKLIQPLIFRELAMAYPPRRVNDPQDPTVAANGQYLLVRRNVYESLGGHGVVADKILEDVELARLFKESHHVIWFENSDAVRTRMYRDFHSLVEGWTKNLALLFRHPLWAAFLNILVFAGMAYVFGQSVISLARGDLSGLIGLANVAILSLFASGFPERPNYFVLFGFPFVSWLMVRSWLRSREGTVIWKGRKYSTSVTRGRPESSTTEQSDMGNLRLKHGLSDEKG